MAPRLRPGMLVVATGCYSKVQVGDIVIISHDGLEKIKRISDIKDDKIYILGDNLDASTDSRHFGWLARSSVLAKVIWPNHIS